MSLVGKEEIEKICFEEILTLWQNQPDSFPDFLPEISEQQKNQNEEMITEITTRWGKLGKALPSRKEAQLKWKQEVDKMLEEFLEKEQVLGIRNHMSQEVFEGFQRETKRFVRKTRSFDSEFSSDNIWQALRNYFIYAVIADLQGQKQECKDAPFAYSLLYPYTDNYIDDKGHTRQQKKDYNSMIYRVLKGESVETGERTEEKTCELLHLVVDSYNGDKRTEVRELLLLMLEAQNNSIRQQMGKRELTEEEVLRISVFKGGMSVLIDYFFAASKLTEEEIRFYLKFGFLLQFADDLQDIEEDKKSGSKTLAVICAEEGRLEEFVNRLLHYIQNIFEEFTPINSNLKNFMREHCFSLIISGAAGNRAYLPKEYIHKLESFFIVHMEYLKKQQERMKGNEKKTPQKAEDYMLQMLDVMTGES